MRKELTCTNCPMGCQIAVETDAGRVVGIEGNGCGRGAAYAETEATDPRRVVTGSVVAISGKGITMVSVKTARGIPKGKVLECAKAISDATANAPVRIGDVIIKDVAGTGVDVIATRGA